MKIHNPLYVPFAIALAIYVGLANHNGWSLIKTVAARTLPRGPSTQHK